MTTGRMLVPIGVIIFSALVSGCCGDIFKGKQTIDVSPLYELDLHLDNVQKASDIIDLAVFDSEPSVKDWSILGDFYNNGHITVLLYLNGDVGMATREFQDACEDLPRVVYGGSGENQYCMSDVRELRASPESFCQPTGEYMSSVYFLKDRLVIYIDRFTGDVESLELDEVILKVAQAFQQ